MLANLEPAEAARWVASLKRSAAATLAEAQRMGEGWDHYALSIASAEAQVRQAAEIEARIGVVRSEVTP